jgi:hypothetical protein
MSDGPTNAVLATLIEGGNTLSAEKFCNIERQLKGIKDHLKTLNGQASKNTKHREKVEAYWKLTAVLVAIPSVVLTVVILINH